MDVTLKMLTERLRQERLDVVEGGHVFAQGPHLLIEHADSPWGVLLQYLCPPAQAMGTLLETIQRSSVECNLDMCIALAIQHAYLWALQATLQQETGLLEARFNLDEATCEENWRTRLSLYCEQIRNFLIRSNGFDFRHLPNTLFIKDYLERFTEIWFKMRLFRQAHEAYDARNFARRISYQIYPNLMRLVATYPDFYVPLSRHLQRLGLWDLPEVAPYKAHLLSSPTQPVCNGTFALQDLYVEMQATHVVPSTQSSRYRALEFWDESLYEHTADGQLMEIVLDQLEDREHVVFIQGKPGMGKSVFCTMLAARVTMDYPEWIPILIRLRDERFNSEVPIEDAIRDYMQPHFTFTEDLLRKRRILCILDGFDELRMQPDSAQGLRRFFDSLSAFQHRCACDHHCRHKIVVTGRPIRMQELESNFPANFMRLNIEPFGNPQYIAWLSNWEKLFGDQQAKSFQMFLEQGEVFKEMEEQQLSPLKELAEQPLVLYLLGTLHRHGIVSDTESKTIFTPVEVYDRLISWVCGELGFLPVEQRSRQLLLDQGTSPSMLRRIFQEIATCTWHGQHISAPIHYVQTYLSSAVPRSAKKLMRSGLRGIYNTLIDFDFQPAQGISHRVEFSHKSFGEYLAAEKMAVSLRQISQAFAKHIDLQSPSLQEAAHRFYSVFGVTLLTDEILDFVMDILTTQYLPEDLDRMTERLYRLYIAYTNGRWMNEDIARAQWVLLKRDDIPLDLLEFEAQAGMNLFVLLCLLYWKTEGTFDICGREVHGTFDPNRFRRLLAFGELVGTFGLFRRVAHLLKRVNLHKANLLCVNFRRVNLEEADLRFALLRDANLRGANLRRANLEGVDLRVTNLQNADLRGANLRKANLEDADLRDANLEGANLEGANFLCAELRNVDFKGAQLREAVLYGTLLQGVNFAEADLTGAIISKQHLARDAYLFTQQQISQLNVVHD